MEILISALRETDAAKSKTDQKVSGVVLVVYKITVRSWTKLLHATINVLI